MNSSAKKEVVAGLQPIDLSAIFEFRDSHAGVTAGVSLATLLQCLCIAEDRHLVPPFEPAWEVMAIPPILRSMSAI